MALDDESVDPLGVTLGASEPEPASGLPSRTDGETARGALAPRSIAEAPRSLGRYTLLDVLGRGGMSVVHEARDEQVGRTVALKLLHAELDERQAERLVREARALARLSHPNVVQVYEVGKHGERCFIVMEKITGRTLRDWQRARPAWRECVRVYLQAGRGLAAAHAAGMTHRDFKPGNCILDDRGRVRVLDFGLARQAEDPSLDLVPSPSQPVSHEPVVGSLTRTGEVLGTLGYMPLEQFEGKRADARSDQWSFCVSLYEALYGERPFTEDSIGALTLALMCEEIRPAPRGSNVPRRLRRVLLRGLAKDPNARWPSMDALLLALAAIERGRTCWSFAVGAMLVAATGLAIELWPRTDPGVATPIDAPAPEPIADDGRPPSPAALELRERAEALFVDDRERVLLEELERIAPGTSLPDDPSLAAEVLLWRGRLDDDAERGATALHQAYFTAREADVPSIESRAAGALTRNTASAHTEGVDEWLRRAWVAVERTPWDRRAAIEVAVTAAHSSAQAWKLLGMEHGRSMLEFADAIVGTVELDDDAFVAWQLITLSVGWRSIGERGRALHWALESQSVLVAVAGPEHAAWPKAYEHIGKAIHPEEGYGGCEEALGYFDEALRGFLAQGNGEDAALMRVEIAGCLRELDRLEGALPHIRLAIDHWHDHEPVFTSNRWSAHLLAGHILADLGRVDEARAEYEQVLAIVDLGAPEWQRKQAKQALEQLSQRDGEREPG